VRAVFQQAALPVKNKLAVALRPSDRQRLRRTKSPRRPAASARASRPLRVLIADDSAMTRRGLRSLLEEQGFEICIEAGDPATAVEAALREGPDVCLVEIKMPGDGIWAIQQIVAEVPATSVLAVTVARDELDVLRALAAGAAGYVLKDTDPETVGVAIRAAARGQAVLPRPFVSRLVGEIGARERRSRLLSELRIPLTSREQEVLELLRVGLTTGEIARRLFISRVTVRTHICSILKKLGVHDRKDAVRLVGASRDLADELHALTAAVTAEPEPNVQEPQRSR
jgi:two-component system, NarL family, nitrate/nitrite response regulator NarL